MNKIKSLMVGALVAVAAFAGVNHLAGDHVNALNPNHRDCESNSIIKCGALTPSELKQKYNANQYGDLPAIFSHYGISSAMINGMTQKQGYITRDGKVVYNGKVVATGATSIGRRAGTGTPIKIAGKTYYQHGAGQNWAAGVDAIAAHIWLNADGQFVAATYYSCGNPVFAKNVVPAKPKPVYACNALSAPAKISRDSFTFSAPSTTAKNGATVKAYNWNFGDGKTVTSPAGKVNHTYTKPGTYKVTVTVTFNVNGSTATVSGPSCATTVTVAPEPIVPVYACNTLGAPAKISRDTYAFNVPSVTAKNATVKNYTWNFGDGETVTSPAGKINHTYAKPGTYKVTVVVTFTVDGKTKTATSANCATTITVTPENCPVPGKEHLPKDSPECKEDKPSINITKTVNRQEHAKVKVGQKFTYEIVVKNTGNIALKNVVVTDNAPAQVSLLTATAGSIANNVWTYTIPELKVGESKSVTLTAQYKQYADGTHKNTVCVDTPTIPGTPDECDDATTETSEDVKVCDTATDTIITVPTEDKNKPGYTTDLSQCEKVNVCDTTTTPPSIITVPKNDQNKPGYEDVDSDKCQPKTPEVPVTPEEPKTPETPKAPEVPAELPHTGITDSIASVVGLGSLVGVGYAYTMSRRIR